MIETEFLVKSSRFFVFAGENFYLCPKNDNKVWNAISFGKTPPYTAPDGYEWHSGDPPEWAEYQPLEGMEKR